MIFQSLHVAHCGVVELCGFCEFFLFEEHIASAIRNVHETFAAEQTSEKAHKYNIYINIWAIYIYINKKAHIYICYVHPLSLTVRGGFRRIQFFHRWTFPSTPSLLCRTVPTPVATMCNGTSHGDGGAGDFRRAAA
eukprot:SAG31_NODE_10797_length_1096_cov_1.475426_2_plen_136_part_00